MARPGRQDVIGEVDGRPGLILQRWSGVGPEQGPSNQGDRRPAPGQEGARGGVGSIQAVLAFAGFWT